MTPLRPLPLQKMPLAHLRPLRGWATDVDHTMTQKNGVLDPKALAMVHRLRQAKVPLVPVTGRSFQFGAHLGLLLPVDLVVSENGFAYHARQTPEGPLNPFVVIETNGSTTSVPLQSLQGVFEEKRKTLLTFFFNKVVGKFKQGRERLRLTEDFPGRIIELTLNLREFGANITPEETTRLHQIFQDAGFSTTHSSIHFHAWPTEFAHSKFSGFVTALQHHFPALLPKNLEHWVFSGDSANDHPMFASFPHTVGVRNVEDHLKTLGKDAPKYWTRAGYGEGFAELGRFLFQTGRISPANPL